MVNQQLLDYIKQQLQQGVSREQIKSSLMANGWQAQAIEEAFAFTSDPTSQLQPVPPPPQTVSSLPGAAAIFGQAWSMYRQRLGTFLGVMLIPVLVTIAILAIFAGGGLLGVSLLSSKHVVGGIGLLVLLAILFFVIIFMAQAWGQVALLYAIKGSQERVGVVESYRRGWRKILSYGWVSLLVGFITLGGFLLLVVPGIIFVTWFSLALFVLIAEDLGGMDALLKSKEYVRGKWGSIFWRLLFIGVVALIIFLALAFILSLLKVPLGPEISKSIGGLFLAPLVMTYLFLVYSNLKALKGKIAFAPTRGKKISFIFVGVLGILLIPAILFSTIFSSLRSTKEKVRDARRETDIGHIQDVLQRTR